MRIFNIYGCESVEIKYREYCKQFAAVNGTRISRSFVKTPRKSVTCLKEVCSCACMIVIVRLKNSQSLRGELTRVV